MHDEIVNRIISWSKDEKQGPFHIQFNPTDRCNLACLFCWQRDSSRVSYENKISEKRYMELIDEAHALHVKKITITGGGEPLCRKDTLKIIKKIKEYEIQGSLITNGTLFNEKNIKEIIRSKWDEVIISLDSPYKETHDYLRQSKGSYDKIIEGIHLFNTYKQELNKGSPKLCIHLVLCNKNYMQIPILIYLAHDSGIKNIFIEPVVTLTLTTDIAESFKLNKQQQKEFPKVIKKAVQLCKKYSIENNFESFLQPTLIEEVNTMKEIIMQPSKLNNNHQPLFSVPCFEPWYNMIIRPNGRVGPCCMFDFSGEYCHSKSLKEIWFGDYFSKVRGSLLKKELPSYCSNCNPSQIVNNQKIQNELKKYI